MIQQATYAVPREDLGEAVLEFDPSTEDFIATEVLPIRPVKRKAATVTVVTRENLKRATARHGNGAAFNRTDLYTEDLEYACVDYGLEGQLTNEDRANHEFDLDAELETTMSTKRIMLAEQEIRVATALFNTSTWTGATLYKDYSGAPWDNIASDIIGQVGFAKEKVRLNCGYTPDSMAIGAASLQNMLANTAIKARFPGVTVITEEMIRANLAAILGLRNLYVGKKTYDSAAEGQDFVGTDIWADDYAQVFRRNEGSLRSGGLGRTLLWTAMSPENITVIQYREEQTDSDIFRVRQFVEEKVFDKYFGFLLKIDVL